MNTPNAEQLSVIADMAASDVAHFLGVHPSAKKWDALGRILEKHFQPIADALTARDREIAELKERDWTGSLVDRLNELARENRQYFGECSDGESASLLIDAIHGQFNSLTAQLADSRKRVQELEGECRDKEYIMQSNNAAVGRAGKQITNLMEERNDLRTQAQKDKERLDWRESHPFPELDFISTKNYAPRIKQQFPNGFWSFRFGRKDDSNRFTTLREALDAARQSPKQEANT